jgi:hypothetical protein
MMTTVSYTAPGGGDKMEPGPHMWPPRIPSHYPRNEIIGGLLIERRLRSKEWYDGNATTSAKLDNLMMDFIKDLSE